MVQWAWRGNQQIWEQAARALLAVLLVVVLAYVIARTVWLIGYGPEDPIPESNLQQVQSVDGRQGSLAVSQSQVDGWRLFGTYQKVPDRQGEEVKAPETRLQLQLLGLFLSRDSHRSSAIIARQGEPGLARVDPGRTD